MERRERETILQTYEMKYLNPLSKLQNYTKLQWLQFQILHGIVPTNLSLFKLKRHRNN